MKGVRLYLIIVITLLTTPLCSPGHIEKNSFIETKNGLGPDISPKRKRLPQMHANKRK
jgi:hypothetical protein